MIGIEEMRLLMQRGFIPGPTEEESVFFNRVAKATHKVPAITLPKFGFSIDWVPVYYSNKNLPFWEGAATWIGEETFIQMREGFKKGHYLGYQREEVLAHEAVHAARIAFDEPQFEEALAYQTSESRLRRWVGPLFRKPWESVIFILSLGIGMVGYFWVPLTIVGWLGLRLSRTQWILRKCLKKLPLSFVVCLTDSEIRRYSRYSDEAIVEDIKNSHSFRSRFLQSRLSENSHRLR